MIMPSILHCVLSHAPPGVRAAGGDLENTAHGADGAVSPVVFDTLVAPPGRVRKLATAFVRMAFSASRRVRSFRSWTNSSSDA